MIVKDLEGIVRACRLEGLEERGREWVASSPFVVGDKEKKLYIGMDSDSYHCKKSNNSGHISELFGLQRGLSKGDAFKELLAMGFVESTTDDSGRAVKPIDPSNPKEVAESAEEDNRKSVVNFTLKSVLNNGQDWSEVAKWRGIPKETFDRISTNGYFGHIPSVSGFGHCYAFLSYEMGPGGLGNELKMIHCRHAMPEVTDQWRSFGSYPIWMPEYRKDATEIWITEGQWDAIALFQLFQEYSPRLFETVQILALSGPKNVAGKKRLLSYFEGKKVIQIMDEDQNMSGEKIFCQTHEAFTTVKDCNHNLLRIPRTVRAKCKDLNDWYKLGITKEEFLEWTECIDTQFSVSANGLCDLEFKEKHGIPLNKLVILDEEGSPYELVTADKYNPEPISNPDILELVKPFPGLHSFLIECMSKNEAPPLWHLTSYLTSMVAICGRRFRFSSGLFPNLYVLNTGPSGIGKSSSICQLQGCLSEAMRDLCLPNNFSSESFLDELSSQNQKIWICGEFAAWVKASEASYKNFAAMTLIDMYDMQYYNKDNPYRISFKKNKLEISNPSISILAACVMDQLQNISNENLKAGLIGRFLFAIGRNWHADMPYSSSISAVSKMRITEFYRSILMTPVREDFMEFSPGAKELFEAEFLKSRKTVNEGEASSNMQTYSSRQRARLIKLSMAFELLMPNHEWPLAKSPIISDTAMIAAIKLDRVFSKCFLEIFEKQFESPDEQFASLNNKLQKKILKFLERMENGGSASLREIRRHLNEDSSTLDRNLKSLKDQSRIVETKKINKIGRPSSYVSLISPIKIHSEAMKALA